MGTVVKRRILHALSAAEDSPHDTVAGMALGDHLYGRNLDDVSLLKLLSVGSQALRAAQGPDSAQKKLHEYC